MLKNLQILLFFFIKVSLKISDPSPNPNQGPGKSFGSDRIRIRRSFLIKDSPDQDPGGHFNYLCTYDLYSPVHNVLDVCISITWGSGRGLGPGIPEFFGHCEMGTSR